MSSETIREAWNMKGRKHSACSFKGIEFSYWNLASSYPNWAEDLIRDSERPPENILWNLQEWLCTSYWKLRLRVRKRSLHCSMIFLRSTHLQEQAYDYKYVFVVIAAGHLHEIHVQISKEGPWFWVCSSFGFDPLSSAVGQTNRTSAVVLLCCYRGMWSKAIPLYCCSHPPWWEEKSSHHPFFKWSRIDVWVGSISPQPSTKSEQ